MAKKKKRNDENVEPKGYIIELKGILLVWRKRQIHLGIWGSYKQKGR